MNTKTVLITGARSFVALDLARIFHSAEVKVLVADSIEMSLCKYSRCVSKFYKIASPAFDYPVFVADLQKIIKDEKVDLLIPTCEEVIYIGKAKELLQTSVFTEDFDKLEILHNKWKFYQLLRKLEFDTPETHLWDSYQPKEGKWILKPIYSRFAANVQVIEGNWPAWEDNSSNPLISQKYIEGEKLCTYTICQDGKIAAHGVYKVLHAMGIGAAICFQSVKADDVDKFVHRLVEKMNFTGQIAFDFIRGDKLYCLECNPRATSGIHLFERSKNLAACFFEKTPVVLPLDKRIIHEHLFMLWYGIKQREIFSLKFWKHFFAGKNPLWMKGDNRVILWLPHIFFNTAKATLFKGKGFHQAMSHDIEYNGEPV